MAVSPLSIAKGPYIQLSVSGVDIEHSFYSYKSILSDRRVVLKEDSIKILDNNVVDDLLISE